MSVPQQFETVVNDAVVTHVAAEIVGRLVVGEQPETESLAYFRQILHLRERALDKLRFVFRLASTPSVGEWEAVRFPQPLFPLYRVVRLVRLARRLGEGRKHRHPETAG
jgi:hypothetical protein